MAPAVSVEPAASAAAPAPPSRAVRLLQRLGWVWRRLRVMSAPEIAWRVRQTLQARLESAGVGLARERPAAGRVGQPWLAALPVTIDPGPYRQAADRVLAGRFDVFALRDQPLGFPPQWNTDPKTGTRAPAVFGKRINYRDEQVCGDIKYLWEPNRHLELVTLAQAWRLTGDDRYAQGCRQLLDSWFEQCPYPVGPNWTSSLEHGIRLVNWAVAWHLLGGESSTLFHSPQGAAFRQRWLRSIHQHCHFIAGWLSRYSSANNHLLGETMGLHVAALTWPLWPESARWRQQAGECFEAEALRQTAADGVNREQAIWYQHGVMEMMLIAGLFDRANGARFGQAFWQRLERMTEYLAALIDRSGNVPMLGDSDDSVMVRWDPRAVAAPWQSLISSGVVLFGRRDWLDRAAGPDDRTRWLLGDAVTACFAAREYGAPATRAPDALAARDLESSPRVRAFEEGGRYILGARFGQADEVLASFDAGPLGYPAIAAHGHADALSLTLSAGGVELLIDPGTFAYHTDRRWRDYFRSTFAHNTVEIDGVDQSVSGGNFLWLRKAMARCLSHSLEGERQHVEGEHDGYRRLSRPVTHRRRVEFDASCNAFTVTDWLEGAGAHRARLCWHLGPRARSASPDAQAVPIAFAGADVGMVLRVSAESTHRQILCGRDDPPAGWLSRSFDQKTATPLLVWDVPFHDRCVITTRIELSFEPAPGSAPH